MVNKPLSYAQPHRKVADHKQERRAALRANYRRIIVIGIGELTGLVSALTIQLATTPADSSNTGPVVTLIMNVTAYALLASFSAVLFMFVAVLRLTSPTVTYAPLVLIGYTHAFSMVWSLPLTEYILHSLNVSAEGVIIPLIVLNILIWPVVAVEALRFISNKGAIPKDA